MQNCGEQTASANCRCGRMESEYRKGSALLTGSISCQILTIFWQSPVVLQVCTMRVFCLCWSTNNPLQFTSLHDLCSTHLQHPFPCFMSVLFSVHCLISALCSTTIPLVDIFPEFLFSHSFMLVSRRCLRKRKYIQKLPSVIKPTNPKLLCNCD